MDDEERRIAGSAVRRAVLGDEWADEHAACARSIPFFAEYEDLVTRCLWGEIWTRPQLDRRTRSCIALVVTLSLASWDEFRLHVRGAIGNGLTADEVKEIILQCALYSGVPRARAAFGHAEQALREIGVLMPGQSGVGGDDGR